MPQKTPEEARIRIVQMRRDGMSYRQIQRRIHEESGWNPYLPTIAKVLKEAGLTTPRPRYASAGNAGTSLSTSGREATVSPRTLVQESSPKPRVLPASTDGLGDFMPKKKEGKVRVAAAVGPVEEFECDSCGAEFEGHADEVPDACPECGA